MNKTYHTILIGYRYEFYNIQAHATLESENDEIRNSSSSVVDTDDDEQNMTIVNCIEMMNWHKSNRFTQQTV